MGVRQLTFVEIGLLGFSAIPRKKVARLHRIWTQTRIDSRIQGQSSVASLENIGQQVRTKYRQRYISKIGAGYTATVTMRHSVLWRGTELAGRR